MSGPLPSPSAARGVMRTAGFLLALLLFTSPAPAQNAEPGVTVSHAVAEFSTPQYSPDFGHFRYANPEAPKGGTVVLAEQGSFDSLNPVILRGQTPRTMGMIYDGLMVRSGDELDVLYGLIAETVEMPEDKSWAVFNLRRQARWHDGTPITANDFVYGWEVLQKHGNPFTRSFLEETVSVEALGDHRLKAAFKSRGAMKPIVKFASTLQPQPRHWWSQPGRDIAQTSLEPPLTSGPYRVAAVDAGRAITYERVRDYWAATLPVNRGFYNFDTIRVDYYRDDDVMFEAFKAGTYDVRPEYRAQRWTTGYDFPAVAEGRVVKRTVANNRPSGAQGLRLNTRRPKLADPRVREALAQLFDFEWVQKNLLYGQYERIRSNFPNSDFGAKGPPTPEEVARLEPYRGKIPERTLTEAFEPPKTDGSGNNRAQLRRALELLREAGWENRGGRLVNAKTGEPFTLEFLEQPGAMVRILQNYGEALKRAGVEANIRVVDSAQYQRRLDEFDFDATVLNLNAFMPPGSELRSYFGSAAADIQGSANYSGIKDPAVDALVEEVVNARDLQSVTTASRALDRVLLWGFYMVPQWYNDEMWVATWTKFGWPETDPRYVAYDAAAVGVWGISTWWAK
ncbi:MAG TPA: extracellular solute-binding protein [Azospirillaceae bacterium]|nr:extracellular solute-binding protein [Azospirillaceae bacterium]